MGINTEAFSSFIYILSYIRVTLDDGEKYKQFLTTALSRGREEEVSSSGSMAGDGCTNYFWFIG